ncbi:DUF1774 domain protein, partial [Metarhizium robertsii]
MNALVVQLFWATLFAAQGAYICCTSRSMAKLSSVLPVFDVHFTVHNLLHVAFAALVHNSQFRLAEVALVCDLLNLLAAYFCHAHGPWLEHVSVVSGPLSWVSVAVLWNGSMMVPQRESLVAAILGTIVIWFILVEAIVCGIAYKDYTMTLFLSVLSGAIGMGQFHLMGGSNADNEHSMPLIILVVQ